MYIKDKHTGKVRLYGTNHHDSLRINNDGTCLTYEHLQCGDGSIPGNKEHSGFLFCDDEGHTPDEDEVLCRYGADAYFNIGGWEPPKWIPVSERLPEKNVEVLATTEWGAVTIAEMYSANDWFIHEGTTNVETDEIVAWMQLPTPYKAESEEVCI